MYSKAEEVIRICEERNLKIYDLTIESETKLSKKTEAQIRNELKEMFLVMEKSATEFLEKASVTDMKMIDGFANKMNIYAQNEKTITGEFLISTMAMAFSTLESSSMMGKIVASPTAGASGILPAVLFSLKKRNNYSYDEIVNAMLTAVGIAKFIGRYSGFAGAEGGCQAETGSAAAMGAAACVYLYGGSVRECFDAASIAMINILGLVCDPIAGLVQYPCTFRNASGAVNALISADMALAGVKSVVPFEEVCQAASEVGDSMPSTLRETGLGGLAATNTGRKIREEFLNSNKTFAK